MPSFLRTHHNPWNEYSNPNGTDFIYNLLNEMPKINGNDFILLDKEIRINRRGTFPIPIGVESTRPSSNYFICQDVPNDPTKFKVMLKYGPDVSTDEPQPLDDKDLKVYNRYTKDNGYPHSPHRYPIEGKLQV